ncbi:MAG: hypothetical protein AB7P02_03465 [Alphaproteobacteria bacterium]
MASRDPDDDVVTHADLYARIAVLEAQIVHLREMIATAATERARILAEVAELTTLVAGIRGAWRVIAAAAGVVGMAVGAVAPAVVKQMIGG